MRGARTLAAVTSVSALLLAACGAEDSSGRGVTLTLVAYDSFPVTGTPLNDALAEFTADTGIEVNVATAGDTGTMVTKAVLTAGNPEGDVMWGVDNTFLSAATDGGIFDGEPQAVDFGDVCLNYDIAWFESRGLAPPETLDDLLLPEYSGLLVVEDPAQSSVGLAFLLATIVHAGSDGWQRYWEGLRANDVAIEASWDEAYYEVFTAGGGSVKSRPLVVSYGSSPPADVVFSDPPRTTSNIGVIADTCFRQTEYAGVLRGGAHGKEAKQLVDFLLSERFQRELPLTLYVYPIDPAVALPAVFVQFAVVPPSPFEMSPAEIKANRERWLDEWNQTLFS